MMKNTLSRRRFLSITPLASMGLWFTPSNATMWLGGGKPNSKFGGVQIGVTTYSYRSMPHDIDQLIKFCVDSQISAIELKGDPTEDYVGKPKRPASLPSAGAKTKPTEAEQAQIEAYNKQVVAWRESVSMDKYVEIRKKFKKAGISIYAYKPNIFEANNTDGEIEYGMKAAKALGATSVTLEMPKIEGQTKRLGDLGAKHKMYVGYHAHLQATDTLWDAALNESPYNTLNIDCGHYIAVGGKNTTEALLTLIETKHDRISSMHLKDRTNDGKQNLEWGKGNTPIKEILLLLKNKKYTFPATIELEYAIPQGSDAVKEVAKCVAFAKAILS